MPMMEGVGSRKAEIFPKFTGVLLGEVYFPLPCTAKIKCKPLVFAKSQGIS
jgi:hypothetical protein